MWKVVEDAPNYEVSNTGDVRNAKTKRLLAQHKSKLGYWHVGLYPVPNKLKHFYTHRLVALAFLGKSNKQVNHKDGNKSHNDVCNLEWVTAKENIQHGDDTGLRNSRYVNCKLTRAAIREIRLMNELGINKDVIARGHGVCLGTIYRVLKTDNTYYKEGALCV